jgi:hypothetical protein
MTFPKSWLLGVALVVWGEGSQHRRPVLRLAAVNTCFRQAHLFDLAQQVLVGIARLVREEQTRIQGAATAARRPLTLLLRSIEAVEVAFPRYAPWIFLGVNGHRGKKGSHKSCDSNYGQELLKRPGSFELNTIIVHVFFLASTRKAIVQLVRRPAAGTCYSSFPGFRQRRIETIA